MLAGQAPFTDVPKRDAIFHFLHKPATPVTAFNSQVPPAVAKLLDRAMAKRTEDRFQTPAALIEELDRVMASLT